MSFIIKIDDTTEAYLNAMEEIKNRLGVPVVEQNLDDIQIKLALNDSIKYYSEKAPGGSFKKYLIIKVSEELKLGNFNIYTLLENPENEFNFYGGIYEITDMLMNTHHYNPNSFWSLVEFQERREPLNYSYTNAYYKTDIAVHNMYMADRFKKLNFEVNKQTGDINIFNHFNIGEYFIVEIYFYYTSDELLTIPWILQFATADARINWGKITGKYRNMMLPGGIEINADRLISEGRYDKQELIDELNQEANPLPFFFY